MKKQFQTTAIYRGVIHLALLSAGGAVLAQTAPDSTPTTLDTVVVKGTRAALQTAIKRKQNSEEIVDSIVADEAGKLPDKSITEVLQRIVGVTVERVRSTNNDPTHFSDGSDDRINVRGLSWGSSTLNGREVFSAGWPGRDLSWSAVPSELMAAVDVYKNPSAERIEGGVSGQVDLRTHLPFDFNGTKGTVSFGSNYEQKTKKTAPTVSALYSTRWDTDYGRLGALVDVALNHSTYEQQHLDLQPYFRRTDITGHVGETVWVPGAADWGQNVGTTDRKGFYGALQWKNKGMESSLTAFVSKSTQQNIGSNIYPSFGDPNYNASPYGVTVGNPVVDNHGVLVSGHFSYPLYLPKYPDGTINWGYAGKGANQFADGGLSMGTSRAFTEHRTTTNELAWNFKWSINDRWAVQNDLQYVKSNFRTTGEEVQTATFMPSMDIATNGNAPVQMGFDQKTRDFLADPGNYYWLSVMPQRLKGDADLFAWKADVKHSFDHPVLRDFTVGVRATLRNSTREQAVYGGQTQDSSASVGWQSIAVPWQVRQTGVAGKLPNIMTADPNNSWQSRANFGYLSDPRYGGAAATEVYNYTPYGGNQPPSVVFPTYAAIKDPATYAKLLHTVRFQQCLDSQKWASDWNKSNPTNTATVPTCDPNATDYTFDTNLYYGINPFKISNVTERTYSAYGNLRFGFDDWRVPMDGNVGVRLVYTGRASHGFTAFTHKYDSTTPADVPQFGNVNDPLDVTASQFDALPSMNLKFNLTGDNKLLGRIGLAKSIYRPGFGQVQEAVTLQQNIDTVNHLVTYTGQNTGNAKLKPLQSNNLDLAFEWYPRSGQTLTATFFYKDVKDLVYNSTYTRTYNSLAGNPQTFLITGPRNAASAKLKGIELNAETYLDHFDALKDVLPDWAKGFGVSANYAYIGSTQKFYRDSQSPYCPAYNTLTDDAIKAYGCDTNGKPLGSLPVPGLVKNAANFALRYDRYGFSARLAYNWTTRVLKNLANNGGPSGNNGTSADPARQTACHGGVCQDTWWGLPQYQEAFGQWDGGVSYSFSDRFNLSLSVTNLNNVIVRRTNQQTPGFMDTSWSFPGRSYNLSGSYGF